MISSINKSRMMRNYIGLSSFGLLVMFISSVIDTTGILNFICYVVMLLFIYLITKKYIDLLFFSCAVFVNSELLNGSVSVLSIRKVFIVLFFFSFVFNFVKKNYRFKMFTRTSVLMFSAWMIYTFFNIIVISRTGITGILNALILFLIAFVTQLNIVDAPKARVKFIWTIFIAFSFIIFVSVLEQAVGRTFFYSRWTITERYRNGFLRSGSTLGDPNNVCYMLVPFLFILQTDVFRLIIPQRLRKTVAVANIVVILLTSSRAGLVALLIGVAFMIVGKRKAIMLLLLPIAGGVANYGLTQFEILLRKYQESTNYRQYIVAQALLVWSRHRLAGAGSTVFFENLGINNAMNTYMYVLGIYGLIGMFFYVVYWYSMIHQDLKTWLFNRQLNQDGLSRIAVVLTSAIIAYSLDVFGMGLMWLCPALFQTMDTLTQGE